MNTYDQNFHYNKRWCLCMQSDFIELRENSLVNGTLWENNEIHRFNEQGPVNSTHIL
jgi:hypothetical protein